jgi:hypothetical protein
MADPHGDPSTEHGIIISEEEDDDEQGTTAEIQ